MDRLNLQPNDIASYFLQRAIDDGDLITNLKMQKLVYYAYCWVLTLNNKKLFAEPIEAWPNGPVVPSLYKALNKFGSQPIDRKFVNEQSLQKVKDIDSDIKYTLDSVYDAYVPLSAFELVALTHSELPWKNARKGLAATQSTNNALLDNDIIGYFSKL